jgi:molybdopterin-guanine dinucleotide biosynthesis protein A
MKQPAGVILAGGQARRMGGGDKGLLALGGTPLLSRVIERLEPQVAELALNANGDGTRFDAYDLPVIADSVDGFVGPLGGVLAGLDWAASRGHSHIVTAAADTPFFPCDLVPCLLLAAEGHAIAMAATPDPARGLSRHPTFALWPVDLRDDLRAALTAGTRKVVAWSDRHSTGLAEFPVTPFDPFFNVNTPEDMARAEALL